MSKKKETESKEVTIESVEYKEIEFTCPIRGKVKQKVKVTKYKSPKIVTEDMVKTSDPIINNFNLKDITGQSSDDDIFTADSDYA